MEAEANAVQGSFGVPGHQRGAVLLVGMVFLLLMSFAGLQLSKRSVLDQYMATNLAVRTIAFENAETALAQAESQVPALSAAFDSGETEYDCIALGAGYFADAGTGIQCGAIDLSSLNWNNSDSIAHSSAADSRFVIEYLGFDEIRALDDDVKIGSGIKMSTTVHVYRLVSRGVQASGSEVILQSLVMVTKGS